LAQLLGIEYHRVALLIAMTCVYMMALVTVSLVTLCIYFSLFYWTIQSIHISVDHRNNRRDPSATPSVEVGGDTGAISAGLNGEDTGVCRLGTENLSSCDSDADDSAAHAERVVSSNNHGTNTNSATTQHIEPPMPKHSKIDVAGKEKPVIKSSSRTDKSTSPEPSSRSKQQMTTRGNNSKAASPKKNKISRRLHRSCVLSQFGEYDSLSNSARVNTSSPGVLGDGTVLSKDLPGSLQTSNDIVGQEKEIGTERYSRLEQVDVVEHSTPSGTWSQYQDVITDGDYYIFTVENWFENSIVPYMIPVLRQALAGGADVLRLVATSGVLLITIVCVASWCQNLDRVAIFVRQRCDLGVRWLRGRIMQSHFGVRHSTRHPLVRRSVFGTSANIAALSSHYNDHYCGDTSNGIDKDDCIHRNGSIQHDGHCTKSHSLEPYYPLSVKDLFPCRHSDSNEEHSPHEMPTFDVSTEPLSSQNNGACSGSQLSLNVHTPVHAPSLIPVRSPSAASHSRSQTAVSSSAMEPEINSPSTLLTASASTRSRRGASSRITASSLSEGSRSTNSNDLTACSNASDGDLSETSWPLFRVQRSETPSMLSEYNSARTKPVTKITSSLTMSNGGGSVTKTSSALPASKNVGSKPVKVHYGGNNFPTSRVHHAYGSPQLLPSYQQQCRQYGYAPQPLKCTCSICTCATRNRSRTASKHEEDEEE
jgi:hypothetical protein